VLVVGDSVVVEAGGTVVLETDGSVVVAAVRVVVVAARVVVVDPAPSPDPHEARATALMTKQTHLAPDLNMHLLDRALQDNDRCLWLVPHSPLNSGSLFSMNAVTASIRSFDIR
jgi:hypothetical protein